MKNLLTYILLLFTFVSWGQDTKHNKLYTHNQQSKCIVSYLGADGIGTDTSGLPFCDSRFEISYPTFKTKDTNFNEEINAEIIQIAFFQGGFEEDINFNDSLKTNCACNGESEDGFQNRPDSYTSNYKIYLCNDSIVSFEIYQIIDAGYGGHSHSKIDIPFCYNILTSQYLKLGDILTKNCDSLIAIALEGEHFYDRDFDYDTEDSVSHYNLEEVYSSNFYTDGINVTFPFTVDWHSIVFDQPASINIEENKQYFNKEFLELIGK